MKKNPVYEKELWAADRSVPFAMAIIGFHAVMAVIALAVFSNMLNYIESRGQGGYAQMLQVYVVLAMVECMIVIGIMPGMAGAGIAQERERRMLSIMKLSGLRPYQIVFGKLAFYMNTVAVLILSGFPALSLVYVYGGIQVREFFWIAAALLVIAFYLGSVSLYCSAVVKKTGHAVVISYAVVLVLVGGTMIAHYWPLLLFGNAYGEEIGSSIAWYHYLLLFNPLITFYGIMNQQAGSREFIFDMINYQGNYRPNWVTNQWIELSMLLQITTALLLLAATVRNIAKK